MKIEWFLYWSLELKPLQIYYTFKTLKSDKKVKMHTFASYNYHAVVIRHEVLQLITVNFSEYEYGSNLKIKYFQLIKMSVSL